MRSLAFLLLVLSWGSFAALKPLEGNALDGRALSHRWEDAKIASVVIFLSSICPCSNSHIAYLKSLPAQFPGVDFYGVHANTDEDASEVKKYFQAAGLPFVMLRDDKQQWANTLKARRTPHAYVINRQGEVVFQGGVTSSATADKADTFYLAEALKDVTSDRAVRTPVARVLGCEIGRP